MAGTSAAVRARVRDGRTDVQRVDAPTGRLVICCLLSGRACSSAVVALPLVATCLHWWRKVNAVAEPLNKSPLPPLVLGGLRAALQH